MRKIICRALTAVTLATVALGAAGCGSVTPAAHFKKPVAAGPLHLAVPVAMANPPANWRSRPPRRVTPGAERHDPMATVCPLPSGPLQSGPVRAAVKNAVFTAYHIARRQRHRFRIDHLIPRELDGSNAIGNLWPQLARGYRAKNRTEDSLHAYVCGGQLTLARAQRLIRKNWLLAYRRYAAPQPRSTQPAPSPPPSSSAPPPAAPPTAAPSPPPAPPSPACYPLSSSGNCYEPGEFCSDADHGMSGVAGDGEAIVCKDNDGWRWEPAG